MALSSSHVLSQWFETGRHGLPDPWGGGGWGGWTGHVALQETLDYSWLFTQIQVEMLNCRTARPGVFNGSFKLMLKVCVKKKKTKRFENMSLRWDFQVWRSWRWMKL